MKIAYTKKETKNLGNYENVSVEISVEDIVDFNIETKDEAFDRLSNFVKTKLEQQFSTDKLKANVSSTKPVSTYVKPVPVELVSDVIADIKAFMLELIKREPAHRTNIKELLSTYGATKLQEVPTSELNNFYIDLKQIGERK
jgi:hypothetical protein